MIDLVTCWSQTTLLTWFNFPTGIPHCDSPSPAFSDLFLSSEAGIFFCNGLLSCGNSDHDVVSVSIDFPSNSKEDSPIDCIAHDNSRSNWDSLSDYLRGVPWEDILKLGASTAASEFCEWFQVVDDVYIGHLKYQAKPQLSSWFSAAFATVITFLICTNKINFLNLK